MSLSCGFCLGDESTMHDSAGFSEVFYTLAGNGITPYGARFSITVNGFTATVASGYALAAGRWLENSEPNAMPVQLSGNNEDRVDALVVRVDYEASKAALEILVDVDADAIKSDPSKLRGEGEYSLLLYLIRVRRGATSLSPEDITDFRSDAELCGMMPQLSDISGKALDIYLFLRSGIDAEVARLVDMSTQELEKADAAIAKMNAAIEELGGRPAVGEMTTARLPPKPAAEWLLCSGGSVPEVYPELSALLDGVLPNVSSAEDRYRTYIYGGIPVE